MESHGVGHSRLDYDAPANRPPPFRADLFASAIDFLNTKPPTSNSALTNSRETEDDVQCFNLKDFEVVIDMSCCNELYLISYYSRPLADWRCHWPWSLLHCPQSHPPSVRPQGWFSRNPTVSHSRRPNHRCCPTTQVALKILRPETEFGAGQDGDSGGQVDRPDGDDDGRYEDVLDSLRRELHHGVSTPGARVQISLYNAPAHFDAELGSGRLQCVADPGRRRRSPIRPKAGADVPAAHPHGLTARNRIRLASHPPPAAAAG
jgi:hypothetical protein